MSSSSDDGSACSSPVGGTQYTAFDTGLDLDTALRQQREVSRKQRMEKMEERRMARQRQAERKRRQFRGNVGRGDGDGDDCSASEDGSTDLLAKASPAPSPPSSPSSPGLPLRAPRISNDGRDHDGGGGRRPSKTTSDLKRGSRPRTSASSKVNYSGATTDGFDRAPSSSSILKYRKGESPSSSPNRVAFSSMASSRRINHKYNGDGSNKSGSPAHRKKAWAPRYDSDSDDCERLNNKNSMENAACPTYRKKAWAPKYDSDSDEGQNDTRNVARNSPLHSKEAWAPKYHGGFDDGQGFKNDTNKNKLAKSSPPRKKWAPNFDSDSDNDGKNNCKTSNIAANRPPPAQTKNPWGSDSDSNDGMQNGRKNATTLHCATKAANKRRTTRPKAAATRRFDSDSESSSDDDLEAMKRRLREKNEKKNASAASTAAKFSYTNINRASHHPSSPSKNGRAESQRPLAARKRSRLAQLTQDSDESDESFAGAMMSQLHAKKQAEEARIQAEREARYKHNPLAMERREREDRNEKILHNAVTSGKGNSSRTPARTAGFEGTEILVAEDVDDEATSISEMGDEASRRGRKATTPLEEYAPRKPSRGTYKYRSSENNCLDYDTDEVGSPKKKQRYSNSSFQHSEDDGLWDDSNDEKTKGEGDDGSDSADDGGKDKRGRGSRLRGSRGPTCTQQPRNRSRLKSKAVDDSDSDSDVPTTKKKKVSPRKKKVPRSRRSKSVDSSDDNVDQPKKQQRSSNGSGGSRWASRYGADDDGYADKPVSDDEVERREGQLKPTFADPKLGPPSPLVPLVLSKTWTLGDPLASQEEDEIVDSDDDNVGNQHAAVSTANKDDDKVPASINRYLQEYQRVGIQFMYSSVIHGKGCVLGDDMGLGKTVQLISLIAALLEKSGTGLDELEIHRHRTKVLKAMRAREENKQKALLTGFGIKDESALESFEGPKVSPILIIVPPSVVQNWQNEFETWGHFNVGIYSGQSREKALDRIKDGRDFILIVGKSLFVRAADYDQIACVEWKLVIVDEFHEFKNGKSQGYMRLADLRDKSGCPLVGMTGTLMQNNHDELYYLIDLVRPFLLGDIREFRDEISKPVMYARAKDAKEGVMRLADKQEQLLRNLIKDVYLERKKEEVLKNSLTQKNEMVIFCELSEIQKKIYRHILTLPDFQLLRFANAPCDCGVNKSYFRGYQKLRTHKEQLNYQRRHKDQLIPRKKCCCKYPLNPMRDEPGQSQIDREAILWIQAHEKLIRNPEDIEEEVLDGKYIACQNCPTCITFSAMNKLYKISSHPTLLQVDPCESGPDAKKKLQFAQVALTPDILRELPGGTHWKSDGIMDDHIRLSGKMKTLDYLLRKYFRRRNRVLVFSYSTAALDVIQNHVKGQGWTNLRLDGQTPTSQRQVLVDKFQNDDSIQIFLISTKAGGLGLNLTAANKVIIFDVNWNPSYDEQAQDRAYRIGQKRDVETVRLVARGTIEELIYARQVYKVQLKKQTLGHSSDGKNQPQIFRGVAKDKNRKGELFGLENLLKFKDGSFMSSLWKSSVDNPKQEHDVSTLAKQLENMDEDQLDELGELGDEGPKGAGKMQHHNANNQDESDHDYGINHQHMLTKGQAQIAPGDEDFNDEMGGETQILDVASKLACERLRSDDDEDDNNDIDYEDQNDHHPDWDPPVAAIPSPVNSATVSNRRDTTHVSAVNVPPRTVKSSAKGGGEAPFPSPVKSSDNQGGLVTTDNRAASDDECCLSPVHSTENSEKETIADYSEKLSPDQSTADQSACHLEGLRTQPPTQPPILKKKRTSKFSLMGTVFENPKGKKNQPAEKKSGGLYIPKYPRNLNRKVH